LNEYCSQIIGIYKLSIRLNPKKKDNLILKIVFKYLIIFFHNLDISTPVTSNGYLKPLLVTHVPGWGGPGTNGQGMNSYPNTPQNHMFHVNSPGNCSIRETSSVHSEPVNK